MSSPIVSVIIPSFNRAKYLPLAIESVLQQTFKDYEIIVVDDGSTDNTREGLKTYRNKISYVYQNNSGVSVARNKGIELAKCDWIAFLDSDDEWMPDYLQQQMEHAQLFPNIVTHMTNSLEVSSDGKQSNIFEMKKLLNEFKNDDYLIVNKPLAFVVKHHLSTLPTTVMNKKFLLKAGLFDPFLKIAEDLDIMARMALQGPLGICKRPLYRIYRRDESTENLGRQLFDRGIYSRQSFDRVYDKLIITQGLSGIERFTLNRVRSANKRSIANLFLRKGNTLEARGYFKQALLIYPSVTSLVKYALSFLPTKIAVFFILKGQHVKP